MHPTRTRDNPSQITTKDLFHVSYLLTQGMEIADIRFDASFRRGNAIFVIQGKDIEKYESIYRSSQVSVDLFEIQKALKEAKDQMFNFYRSQSYRDENQKPDKRSASAWNTQKSLSIK